jgi:phage head maturation protease
MAEQERRTISSPVELRVVDEKSGMSGYAAVFGSATEIAGMFREQIAPGAFAEAVKRDDVRALFNHDANFVLVKRGDISQSSFAFEVTDEEWDYGKRGEMPMRTIKNVRLYDVSPVTYPAYSATSVSARTLQAAASGVLDATRLDVDEQWTVDNSRQRIRLSEKA